MIKFFFFFAMGLRSDFVDRRAILQTSRSYIQIARHVHLVNLIRNRLHPSKLRRVSLAVLKSLQDISSFSPSRLIIATNNSGFTSPLSEQEKKRKENLQSFQSTHIRIVEKLKETVFLTR